MTLCIEPAKLLAGIFALACGPLRRYECTMSSIHIFSVFGQGQLTTGQLTVLLSVPHWEEVGVVSGSSEASLQQTPSTNVAVTLHRADHSSSWLSRTVSSAS